MFRSFCLRQQRGEFDLAGRDELWKLLVTITLRKARNAANAHRRKKRDVAREQDAPAGDRRSGEWMLELMDSSAPTPDEAMVLNEALEPPARGAGRPRTASDLAMASGRIHQSRNRRPIQPHGAGDRAQAWSNPQPLDVVR